MNRFTQLGLWLFAFVLALPAVHAQTLSNNQWVIFTVNTLVIFAAFFIFITYVLSNLEQKERVAIQLVALAGAGLIAWNWLGGTGYIWQVGPIASLFNWNFVINTAILAGATFFILPILGLELKENRARVGAGVFILLVAGVIASRLTQPIWEFETFKILFDFLLGEQGILTIDVDKNEYRLFVFVISTALLVMFFKLLKFDDDAVNKKLMYLMAIVIGANLASGEDPMSLKTLTYLGTFFIATLFTVQAAKGSSTGVAVAKGAVIFPTVWYVSFLLFEDIYKSESTGSSSTGDGILSIFSGIGDFFGVVWDWILGGGILVAGIVGFFIFKWLAKQAYKRGPLLGRTVMSSIWNRLWIDKIRRNYRLMKLANFFGAQMRDLEIEGAWGPTLKRIKIELFSLYNYLLRYQTFLMKFGGMEALLDQTLDDEHPKMKKGELKPRIKGDVARFDDAIKPKEPDMDDVMSSVIGYHTGEIPDSFDDVLAIDAGKDPVDLKDITSGSNESGFSGGIGVNRTKYVIYMLMKSLALQLQNPQSADLGTDRKSEALREKILNTLGTLKDGLDSSFDRYVDYAFDKTGMMHRLNSVYLLFLDMNNMQGQYLRGYRFAKEEAIPLIYTVPVSDPGNGHPVFAVELGKAKFAGVHSEPAGVYETTQTTDGITEMRFEIDDNGFFTDDVNKYRFMKAGGHGDPPKEVTIRRIINPGDIVYNAYKRQSMSSVFTWSIAEWQFFLDDMHQGKYHPWSNLALEYKEFIENRKFDLSSVPFHPRKEGEEGQEGRVTYDREALKDPSKFVYWGKEKYYDTDPRSLNKNGDNPYPYCSIKGSWEFMQELTHRLSGNHLPAEVLNAFSSGMRKDIEGIERNE